LPETTPKEAEERRVGEAAATKFLEIIRGLKHDRNNLHKNSPNPLLTPFCQELARLGHEFRIKADRTQTALFAAQDQNKKLQRNIDRSSATGLRRFAK